MKLKYVAIFLVLLCCLMGAASAAEDVSTDVVDASADAVVVDAVSEDVSDSVESIDDEVEPVVVESASAQEENDDVELVASVDEEPALEEIVEGDSGQSHVLGDSGDSSFNEIHLDITNPVQITEFLNELDQDTIVYLDAITYEYISVGNNNGVSIFLVGSGDGTVIGDDNYPTSIDEEGYAGIQKFINMTILGEIFNNFIPEEEGYVEFINCNFKGHAINIGSTNPSDVEVYEAYGFNPCITNFINCTFSDFNDLTASYIISSKCYQSNFYNCTFKNINADSLINTTAAYGVEDLDAGISIMCCTFENCDVKGIVQGTNLQFVDK